MKKLAKLAALAVVFVFSQANAAPLKTNDPKAYAKSIGDSVVTVIKSGKSEEDKFNQLETLFKENVDTDFMGKFAMGRYFKTAKPDLQKKYLSLYRDYVMYSYVPKFKNYASQKVEILSSNPKGKDEFMVKTKLRPESGEVKEILLDYRVKKTGNSFKIVDIIGEGVSYITNQRNDFGSALSKITAEDFVNKLEQKVSKLKANAI